MLLLVSFVSRNAVKHSGFRGIDQGVGRTEQEGARGGTLLIQEQDCGEPMNTLSGTEEAWLALANWWF